MIVFRERPGAPPLPPGVCVICLSAPRPGQPFVDTEVDFETKFPTGRDGRLYLCQQCVASAAYALENEGFRPTDPVDWKARFHELAEWRNQVVETLVGTALVGAVAGRLPVDSPEPPPPPAVEPAPKATITPSSPEPAGKPRKPRSAA